LHGEVHRVEKNALKRFERLRAADEGRQGVGHGTAAAGCGAGGEVSLCDERGDSGIVWKEERYAFLKDRRKRPDHTLVLPAAVISDLSKAAWDCQAKNYCAAGSKSLDLPVACGLKYHPRLDFSL
jgi:hypothetical protein